MDWTAALQLCGQQYGVVHRTQLRDLGYSWATVDRATRRGMFQPLTSETFHVASAPVTFHARAMAAQLHCQPHGFLTSFTAARLYNMRSMPAGHICVLTFRRQKGAVPAWIDRSYTNWHDSDDVVERDGFLLERPDSLLFSLAAVCNDHRFERAAEDAWNLKLVTPQSLDAYLQRHRRSGRAGVARLSRWLDKTVDRPRSMQSNFEVDLLAAVRRVGLPEPCKQHALVLRNGETIHLDLAWPDLRLAVEPGHSWFHGGELAKRRDERRDNACAELGWLVVRYGEDARADLGAAAAEIARIYGARAS